MFLFVQVVITLWILHLQKQHGPYFMTSFFIGIHGDSCFLFVVESAECIPQITYFIYTPPFKLESSPQQLLREGIFMPD